MLPNFYQVIFHQEHLRVLEHHLQVVDAGVPGLLHLKSHPPQASVRISPEGPG